MKTKITILGLVFTFLVFASGWAKESYAEAAEAPLMQLWEQSYSPSLFINWLNDLSVDSEDNIIVTGFIGLGDNITTIKYDSDGEVIWTNTESSVQTAWAITVDSLNNIIVGGGHPSTGYNIIKYLPDGTTAWTRTYDNKETGTDTVWSVVCDGEDNIIVLGDMLKANGWMTLKYDKDGTLLWDKMFSYPGGGYAYPKSVAVDSSNNIIIAGYGYYYSLSSIDMIIIKYNPDGSMLWSEPVVYDSGEWDYANAVCVDKDDNMIVVGHKGIPAHDFHLFVRKYDSNGNFIWEAEDNSAISMGYAVTIDKNDRILAGGTKGRSDKENYMVCYDTSGNRLWDFAYNPTNGSDEIYGLAVDSNNNIAVGSTVCGTYLTEKYGYCGEWDLDDDRDVDGSDLAIFAAGYGVSYDKGDLSAFAGEFGKTNCTEGEL